VAAINLSCNEMSPLLYHSRALPPAQLLPCRRGLEEMRVPLSQPGLARKQQALPLAGGSV